MDIQKVLIKLNMSFLIKDDKLLEKYDKIWDSNTVKSAIVLKKDLIVNQYTMKNN